MMTVMVVMVVMIVMVVTAVNCNSTSLGFWVKPLTLSCLVPVSRRALRSDCCDGTLTASVNFFLSLTPFSPEGSPRAGRPAQELLSVADRDGSRGEGGGGEGEGGRLSGSH